MTGGLEKFGATPHEEQIPKIPEVEAFQRAVIDGGGRIQNTYKMKNGFIPFKEVARMMGGYGKKLLDCAPDGITPKKVGEEVGCTPGDFVNAMAHVQNITADKVRFETKFWGGNFEWWAITDVAKEENIVRNDASLASPTKE